MNESIVKQLTRLRVKALRKSCVSHKRINAGDWKDQEEVECLERNIAYNEGLAQGYFDANLGSKS